MLVNGTPQSTISLTDRGLNYGDGLFETLAAVNGNPCLWERHMARLGRGCARLGISMPEPAQLLEECIQTAKGKDRCVLKIIVTRGEGGRGYRPLPTHQPNRVVRADPWHDYTDFQKNRGIALRVCRTTLGQNPILSGIKHLNRLEQVLARAEWSDPKIVEGIMLDSAGNVVECTMSNLFLFRRGRLETPMVDQCGVAGVVRELAMESATEIGLEPLERRIKLTDLADCEALFITNSLMGALPVARIDSRKFNSMTTDSALTSLVQLIRRRAFQTGVHR